MTLFYSLLASAAAIGAFVPYLYTTFTRQTKPHIFSWIIWGATTSIVFVAQLSEGAGRGAWPIGLSALLSFVVAATAMLRHADGNITRSDWVFFLIAVAAIPVWLLTENALWAVVMVTLIDLLGFGPTLRKSYMAPYEENVLLYLLMIFRGVFAITALEVMNLATVLFPLAISLASAVVLALLLLRRRQLAAC